MQPADVDVVIVSWNVREELVLCVASVLAQVDVQPHVIVVDNNSSDGSADAIAERFPGVTLVRNSENLGFAKAVNQGAALGQAPYLMWLNPDTFAPHDVIRRMIDHLAELPQVAALAPRLVYQDESPQHSVYPFPSVATSVLMGTGLHRLLPRGVKSRMLLPGSWDSNVERDVPWAIGAAMLIPRPVWQKIGPLDESFFVYAEDIDWCDRAGRAGYKIRFWPGAEVVHHGNRSGAQGFGEGRTKAHMTNALTYMRRRHGRAWTAAYVAVNSASVMCRYNALRTMMRLGLSRNGAGRIDRLRTDARFYADLIRGR